MKKNIRTLIMLSMSVMLLLLSACGSSSSKEVKEDNVEVEATEQTQEDNTEVEVTAPSQVSASFDKAVDGVLELKMENAGIVINGTGVAMPYAFEEIVAAGVPDADYLRSVELGAGEFYSVNIYLDEMEDYLIIPAYYNEGEETISITEAEASEITMSTYASEPVDQNVSILGIKFGMTKAEVIDILGEPSYEDGEYYEWQVTMADSNYEGYFTIYFTSGAEDAVVCQADLDITDYGF